MIELKILTAVECYQATIGYAHRLGRKIQPGTHAGDHALCQAQARLTAREIVGWLEEPCTMHAQSDFNNPERAWYPDQPHD